MSLETNTIEFKFALGEAVAVPDIATNSFVVGTVVLLIHDGQNRYRVSWMQNGEFHYEELEEWRIEKYEPQSVKVDEGGYDKLKPSKTVPMAFD